MEFGNDRSKSALDSVKNALKLDPEGLLDIHVITSRLIILNSEIDDIRIHYNPVKPYIFM